MNPKEINEFKESLSGKTVEELKALEQEIIAEADKVNNELSVAKIAVPSKNYKEACVAIRRFLDKQSVQWQYTLGMKNMYETWDPDKKLKEVAYPVLDATIRTIGALQFTGYKEWLDVVMVTEFFEPTKEEYSKIAQASFDVADKHAALMDVLQSKQAIEEPVQINETK